jgi:maleylpyruvate isomerase
MDRTRVIDEGWVATGTELCEGVMTSLSDVDFAEPSRLPGWTRAHVIAHIDGNARGLGNLVSWARTGIETTMYSSMEQRDADIEAGALLPPQELRARLLQSSAQLADGFNSLSEEDWSTQVRTAQGRMIAAREVIWLRAREVMIHAVDLGGDVTFEDLPDDFLIALTDDVVARRGTLPGHPAIALQAPEHRWDISGEGAPAAVDGSLPQIAAYVTGRRTREPLLPGWL